MWAWLNGAFIKKDRPAVRLEDRGLTFADGLFEVLRTIGGKVLFFDEHFARMQRSAEFLRMPLPYAFEELRQIALELIAKNEVARLPATIPADMGTHPA